MPEPELKLTKVRGDGADCPDGRTCPAVYASNRGTVFIVGKRVRVKQNGKTVPGRVEDVDPMDGIVLRLDSGHPRTIRSEHVEHLEVLE